MAFGRIGLEGESTGGTFKLFVLAVVLELGSEPVIGNGEHLSWMVGLFELLVLGQVLQTPLPSSAALVG